MLGFASGSEFEEAVDRAYKFLIHPRVASASVEKRIAFLETKNCSSEVIQAALKRAEMENMEAPPSYQQETCDDDDDASDRDEEVTKGKKKKTRRHPKERRKKQKAKSDQRPWLRMDLRPWIACGGLLFCVVLAIAVYSLLALCGVIPPFFDDTTGHSSSKSVSISNSTAPTATLNSTSSDG